MNSRDIKKSIRQNAVGGDSRGVYWIPGESHKMKDPPYTMPNPTRIMDAKVRKGTLFVQLLETGCWQDVHSDDKICRV